MQYYTGTINGIFWVSNFDGRLFSSLRNNSYFIMYWNELNPRKHKVSFEFDSPALKKDNDGILTRIKKNVFDFIHLFFSSSNIHGFNHLTNKMTHFSEKLIWLMAICTSIYGSAILGSSTWTRYQENPTVISMDREYKEWATALPAVTLCPTNKIDDERFDNMMQTKFANYSDSEKEEFRAFLELLANATYGTFKDVTQDARIVPKDYLDTIDSLRGVITHTISNSHVDITSVHDLESTITELGFCYSYNGEIAPYNNYEWVKYWKSHNTSILPRKEIISGTPLDGDVFIQITSMNFGYLGFLHSPYDFPDMSNRIYTSLESFYKTLDVTALSIYSTPETIALTPKQRKCRFLNESDLHISPVYTYNICRIQCRMNQAKKLCGCVPYFYKPRKNYKICDVNGMHCLDQYKDFLIKLRNGTGEDSKVKCGCLPPCDDVNYIVEGDNTIQWFLGTNLKWGLIKYPRLRLKRTVLFGFTDVLVSIGGTAGLFLGCSVLSFLEILYFFSFHLAFTFFFKK